MGLTTDWIPYHEALTIAGSVIEEFSDACTRISLTGGLRRQEWRVNRIDLICEPEYESVPIGLFGEVQRVNLLDATVRALIRPAASDVAMRFDPEDATEAAGRVHRLSYRGVPVNLVSVLDPDQWGALLALTTGPAPYVQRLTSHPSVKLADGSYGVLPWQMRVEPTGLVWNAGVLLKTPTEESFVASVGQPWIEPEDRR